MKYTNPTRNIHKTKYLKLVSDLCKYEMSKSMDQMYFRPRFLKLSCLASYLLEYFCHERKKDERVKKDSISQIESASVRTKGTFNVLDQKKELFLVSVLSFHSL